MFRTVSAGLGDRLRRIPDGETGPRADWIVWQYPVLSSRPQFEVAPPAPGFYRALPQLRLRAGESGDEAVLALTRRYLEIAEEDIRGHPAMWLWMHRRWEERKRKAAP